MFGRKDTAPGSGTGQKKGFGGPASKPTPKAVPETPKPEPTDSPASKTTSGAKPDAKPDVKSTSDGKASGDTPAKGIGFGAIKDKVAPESPSAPAAAEGAGQASASAGGGKSAKLDDVKVTVFNDLLEAVDIGELGSLSADQVREEITDMVSEIISMRGLVLSHEEQGHVVEDICNDVLGLGPLEPLIARDDIADIMVNGPDRTFIEVDGKIQLTDCTFRDGAQLMNICQRIVTAVGRRVDESSPICDARLADGSRVNVIAPPLAIDGAALTIRKFRKEKLTLEQLESFGSISAQGREVLEVISECRINCLISGGTGSGKTTLLNCMTRYIDPGERVITCEDAAELQLQQPHVVRLETRPPNLEGKGEITMRDLVKNCLRMRPERIIVGEVRGPEAFDLLQAMNTGHDGSMGTVHANNPREAIGRVENMIAMGGFSLPAKAMREQIAAAINVIIQASRLRDGTRKITHITEVVGMEGDVVTLQDLFVYEMEGEDEKGKIIGYHRPTGMRPAFWDKARYYGLERKLAQALAMDSGL